jgi:hypothetical protein
MACADLLKENHAPKDQEENTIACLIKGLEDYRKGKFRAFNDTDELINYLRDL